MSSLQQNFTVHPVGQGLFYSGSLDWQRRSFDMVFDCGSLNGLDISREVTAFREERLNYKNEIDLLVISHFDADHVNHIQELLAGGVKIRRLVMPFLGFADRLFLVLKYVGQSRGYDRRDDGVVNFIIDPLGELRDNLDGGSEIYLVENDPKPIRPDDADTIDDNDFKESGQGELVFDFESKEQLTTSDLANFRSAPANGALYKVLDKNKGFVAASELRLMDFLFYKKPLGPKEDLFYKEVFRLFCTDYGLNQNSVDFKEQVKDALINLNRAEPVRQLFRRAAAAPSIGLAPAEVDNLNTTALCLLHRNLRTMLKLIYGSDLNNYVDSYYFPADGRVWILHRFKGHDEPFRQLSMSVYCDLYVPYQFHQKPEDYFVFPNTMLTSDTFLSDANEVAAFEGKYRHFLRSFWLFQVPHHGSRHNSNDLIFSIADGYRPMSYFANYGLNNRFGHPSQEMISAIDIDCYHDRFYPVHEKQGLTFELILSKE